MQYTEIGKTEFKLTLIAKNAEEKPEMQFTSLAHLLDEEYLKQCFRSLDRNRAKGIDNVGWYNYNANLNENIGKLVSKLKAKKFKPLPARRVYIPKEDGRKRPLGISALENKIVEKGIKGILESIYEQDFSGQSFGFRPNLSCHHALKEVHKQITSHRINHIVEADIKGFFDNVSHEQLMKVLERRIKDRSMLNLIGKFLKAGYVDNELLVVSDTGTPQGSILSPLLANIFLHYVLDEWFENVVKPNSAGYCELIRYADDFIIVVQFQGTAIAIERGIWERFAYFGLEINPEKSKRLSFGRFECKNATRQNRRANTFEFLGITHYCDVSRKGNFKVGCKTSRKKFVNKCREMTIWLKKIRNLSKPKEWWGILNSKLRGHYQYYGVSENYRSIQAYYKHTIRTLYKWLNRRSQKLSMNWTQFIEYLIKYPLEKPRICHNFYGGKCYGN